MRADVLAGDEAVQRVAQVGDAGVVDGAHLGQGALRVVEAGGATKAGWLLMRSLWRALVSMRTWNRIRPKGDSAAEHSAISTEPGDLPRKIPVDPR